MSKNGSTGPFCQESEITINPRLILKIKCWFNQKSPYFIRKIREKRVNGPRISLKRFFALFLILLLPISVSAGMAGILGNLFLKKNDSLNVNDSLQNMKLLTAVASPSVIIPELNTFEGTLVAETSPFPGSLTSLVTTSDQISVYVVREGDTLSQIAQMFNVTVNTVKWANDIPDSKIKPGQTLIILPISGVKHTVVKGETLAAIAKKYNGDIIEIADYNGISREVSLMVGTEIIIPDGEIVTPTYFYSSNISGSKLKEYVGYYLRPIIGGRKTQGLHGYNGVDLASYSGAYIMASADGEVIISRTGSWNGGYGNYIVIKHNNGTQTLYAHNSRNIVSVGENVKQGQIIGHVGSTGRSTGPHLHFEIRGAKNPF